MGGRSIHRLIWVVGFFKGEYNYKWISLDFGKSQNLRDISSFTVSSPNPHLPSGQFTAPYRYPLLRLTTVSPTVGVDYQDDANTERIKGKKLWQLRCRFPILATSVAETSGGSFAWSRRACLWSHLVERLTDRGESKRENFGNPASF